MVGALASTSDKACAYSLRFAETDYLITRMPEAGYHPRPIRGARAPSRENHELIIDRAFKGLSDAQRQKIKDGSRCRIPCLWVSNLDTLKGRINTREPPPERFHRSCPEVIEAGFNVSLFFR